MINIDFLTIKAFVSENLDFFVGSRIQKIQQPTRRDFIFSLRNYGISRKLYININPQIYHISFISSENEQKRNIKIPKQPPMFCMLLRKYLEGAKISDARAVENERIIEFIFETFDELSQQRNLCLCIELMGKHSNVILYDKETGIIIGCAHNIGSEKSKYRELQGGLKYIYPPKKELSLPKELNLQFKNLSQEKIKEYLNSDDFNPAMNKERYTLFKELIENPIPQNSVSEMLDNYYSAIQENLILLSEKTKLSEIVNSKLKKIKNAISKIDVLLKKRDNTQKYKLYGELLTANIYQKKDFYSSIKVFNYNTNENIDIELDKTKTLKENAQRYFKLYAKSKNTKEKSEQVLTNLKLEKEYCENVLYSISIASCIKDLEEIKQELNITEEQQRTHNSSKSVPDKLTIKNFDVYIGKNNKQNDYIISKLAKDEDVWFHTRLCAGSHVLLKTNGMLPDEETIYECCKLARKYSSANQPSKVGVIYTKAKNLRKPPSAPLGYVTYKNEKEILI